MRQVKGDNRKGPETRNRRKGDKRHETGGRQETRVKGQETLYRRRETGYIVDSRCEAGDRRSET